MDRVAADAPLQGAPEILPSVESLLDTEDFRMRIEKARAERQKTLGANGRGDAGLMRDSRPWERSDPEEVIRRRAIERERKQAERAAAGVQAPAPDPIDPLQFKSAFANLGPRPFDAAQDATPAAEVAAAPGDEPVPDISGSGPVAGAVTPLPAAKEEIRSGGAQASPAENVVVLPRAVAATAPRGRAGLIAAGFVLLLGLGLGGVWLRPGAGPERVLPSMVADAAGPGPVRDITELSASSRSPEAMSPGVVPGTSLRVMPAARPALPPRLSLDAVPAVPPGRSLPRSPGVSTTSAVEPVAPEGREALPPLPAAEAPPQSPQAVPAPVVAAAMPAAPAVQPAPAVPLADVVSRPLQAGVPAGPDMAPGPVPAADGMPRALGAPRAAGVPEADRLAATPLPPPLPRPDYSAFEVTVLVPGALTGDAGDKAMVTVRSAGFTVQRSKAVGHRVKETHVRYYHEEDLAAAEALAAAFETTARSFVGEGGSAAPGALELWLSGDGASGPAVKPKVKSRVAAKPKKARPATQLSEAAQAKILRDRILKKLRAGATP